MTTPQDLSTKLKAVNVILAGMGEVPITTLDASQSGLAQKAEDVLDETSRTLQAKGYYWNSEDDYSLSPDASGNVYLPANTTRVSRAYIAGSSDILIQRGQKIYNRTKHTFTFPQGTTVKVDIVVYLDWDDLPEFAKQAAIYPAQKRFQIRELTSNAIDSAIENDLQLAIATLEQAEDAQGPANQLNDSTDSLAIQGNIRRRP